MFKHFLITRFNIRLKEWSIKNKKDHVLSEVWLEKRFYLFETYCLPSVINQSCQAFNWLLCFDSETPIFYKDRIERLIKSHPNFKVLYLNQQSHFLENVILQIEESLSEKETHILTTRLDNDDAIHKDFIETIQSHYKPTHKLIIDVKQGYQFIKRNEKSKDAFRTMTVQYNPFISLIEGRHNIETILSRQHLHWQEVPTITVSTSPLWLQLVHEDNIANAEKLQYPETNNINFSNFGIKYYKDLKSNLEIISSNLWSYVLRLLIKLKIVSLPSFK